MKKKFFGLVIAALVAMLVVGCSQQVNPVADSSGSNAGVSLSKRPGSDSDTSTLGGTTIGELRFVQFPIPNRPYNDILTSTKTITSEGGTISVKVAHYDEVTNEKVSSLTLKLKVLKNAVSGPVNITLAIDPATNAVTANFAPHGTVFAKPAQLDVDASGLDLTGFNNNDLIDLYYYDEGWQDAMAYRRFRMNVNSGTIQATDIQIPHFSIYAFGRRR
jgi:hypothetical protein